MTQSRDITFDIMKGIGIILVLIGHVWSVYTPNAHRFIFSFHMPMFFIVAGYFSKSYTDKQSAWHSVKHFFIRLCVPAIITQIAIVLWALLDKYAKGGSWDGVITELLSVFWADVYGPMTPWGKLTYGVIWFLLALFVSKCLLLLFSRLKAWAIPISFSLALGAIALHHVFPYSIWSITLGLTALPFVTIGWWFRNNKIPIWLIVVCIACWVIAFVCSDMDMYEFRYACYPLNALGAMGGTYCLYWFCKAISKLQEVKFIRFVPRMFAYLGVISLIIMCVHCFELYAHLGSHCAALFSMKLSIGGMYVFRYLLTILLAVAIDLMQKGYGRFVKRKIA